LAPGERALRPQRLAPGDGPRDVQALAAAAAAVEADLDGGVAEALEELEDGFFCCCCRGERRGGG